MHAQLRTQTHNARQHHAAWCHWSLVIIMAFAVRPNATALSTNVTIVRSQLLWSDLLYNVINGRPVVNPRRLLARAQDRLLTQITWIAWVKRGIVSLRFTFLCCEWVSGPLVPTRTARYATERSGCPLKVKDTYLEFVTRYSPKN